MRAHQQQLRCCGCLVLLAAALVASLLMAGRMRAWMVRRHRAELKTETYGFPLELTVQGKQFLHYQVVPITLHLTDPQGRPVVTEKPPVLTVWFNNAPVTTVGNLQKLQPRYEPKSQDYRCNWPVPWGAPAGTYIVVARMQLADPAQWRWAPEEAAQPQVLGKLRPPRTPRGVTWCTAQANIQVVQQTPPAFPLGTCFATWEGDFPNGPVALPRGGKSDWHALIEWCKFMGADTLLFRGAYTSSERGALGKAQPWVEYDLNAIPGLAEAAHQAGLKFGVWAIAYETFPNKARGGRELNAGKPPYQYAQDISRTGGQARSLDFISLLDKQRVKDLAAFAAKMQADPNVDFVGLDYMRSDRGGYEMTGPFTSEMPVKLPVTWSQMGQQQRWEFMAGKIEKDWQKDPNFYEQWNWWRAHQCAEIAQSIIAQGQLTKPLYIFMLSWEHGFQHGQDAIMFNDAGVGCLLPMLYQMPSQRHFEWTMRAWQSYLRAGQANLAPGDEVDVDQHDVVYHHRSLNPAGPELLYQRMVAAHRRMIPGSQPVGAFFHDISRAAVKGNLGPYPGTEWALAGAAAFSQARQDLAVYPLRVSLAPLPGKVAFGAPIRARVTIENVSAVTINNLSLRLEDTPGVTASGPARKTIPALGAGEKIEVPLAAEVATPIGYAERGNRFMVCLRLDWPQKDYGQQFRNDLPTTFVLMQYVQVSASGR
jgi:hypothetical protein